MQERARQETGSCNCSPTNGTRSSARNWPPRAACLPGNWRPASAFRRTRFAAICASSPRSASAAASMAARWRRRRSPEPLSVRSSQASEEKARLAERRGQLAVAAADTVHRRRHDQHRDRPGNPAGSRADRRNQLGRRGLGAVRARRSSTSSSSAAVRPGTRRLRRRRYAARRRPAQRRPVLPRLLRRRRGSRRDRLRFRPKPRSSGRWPGNSAGIVIAATTDKLATAAPFRVAGPEAIRHLVVDRAASREVLAEFEKQGSTIHFA